MKFIFPCHFGQDAPTGFPGRRGQPTFVAWFFFAELFAAVKKKLGGG